jgi:hypothetical protein
MYSNVIREARNEQEIYFLLNAYVEAVRFADQLNVVPEPLKRRPLDGRRLVKEQYQKLLELDRASGSTNDSACPVIKEALPIFGAALERLETLKEKQN